MQTATDQPPHTPQLLLREWVQHRRDADFRKLVERYYHLVYGVAFRRTRDRAAAEDITQVVFADLARDAGKIRNETPGGWLVRHAGFLASRWLRGELRRRARETAVAVLGEPASCAETGSASLPIDEAIAALPAPEREAVVLRFLEAQDFRAVGVALGISGNAAQKRVTRGLERLRTILTRKGFTGSTAALGALISIAGQERAPAAAGKIASAAAHALEQQTGTMSGGGTGAGIAGMTIAAAAASFVFGAVPAFFWSANPSVSAASASARQQSAAHERSDPGPDLEQLLSAAENAHTFTGRVRFTTLTSRLVPSDYPALLGAMGPRSSWHRAAHLLSGELHSLWAAAAPAECIAWHRSHPQEDSPSVIRAALSRMAQSDAPAAVAAAAGVPGFKPAEVIGSVVTSDPESAFHRASELALLAADPAVTPESLRLDALSQLFRKDPACAALLAPSALGGLGPATAPVFSQWAEADVRAAWKWAETLPPPDHEIMQKVFPLLLTTDPELALQAAGRRPELVNGSCARDYAEVFARQDPAAALRWYETLQADPVRTAACSGLLPLLPPADARRLLAEIPGKELQDQIIAAALDRYPVDPLRAEALAALGHSHWLLHNAVNSWQQNDPAGAWEAALKFASPERRQEALLLILKGDQMKSAAKLQLVEALDDPDLQARCRKALQLQAVSNPVEALAAADAASDEAAKLRILDGMLDGAPHSAWMTEAGAAVLRRSIETAGEFVAADGKRAGRVAELAAFYWARNFPDQMAHWITSGSLPDGSIRDDSLEALAQNHPVQATRFSLALTLSDPAQKLRVLRQIYSEWVQSDPASAATALTAAALSGPDKSMIREGSAR